MVPAPLIGLVAIASGAYAAFLLGNFVAVRVQREYLAAMSSDGEGASSLVSRLLRNGINALKPAARFLLKRQRIAAEVSEACLILQGKGYASPCESLLSLVLGFLIVAFVVSTLITRTIVCGLAIVACAVAIALAFIHASRDKRAQELRESIPDALRAMGVCFQSGYSLLQTFEQVSAETHGDLRALFAESAHILQTGGTTPEALEVLASRDSAPELAFVSVALDVQHQSGGSIKQVLDSAVDMVESELDLARSLRVQTAQAKLSARVVSVMPFVLLALFSFMSPGFLTPFFTSAFGIALLVIALGMQFAGIMAVRRMLKVGE